MPHCPNCGEDLSGWPVTDTEVEAQTRKDTERSNELSQMMTFGKYRNCSLDHVMGVNPQYVVWAAENVDHFNISEALLAEARNKASTDKVQPPELDQENKGAGYLGYLDPQDIY